MFKRLDTFICICYTLDTCEEQVLVKCLRGTGAKSLREERKRGDSDVSKKDIVGDSERIS